MRAENFRITEDGQPQTLSCFVKEEAPVSIAIVADLSDSMAGNVEALREAVAGFREQPTPRTSSAWLDLVTRRL